MKITDKMELDIEFLEDSPVYIAKKEIEQEWALGDGRHECSGVREHVWTSHQDHPKIESNLP